jgi:AraC-like DNA-binding protein
VGDVIVFFQGDICSFSADGDFNYMYIAFSGLRSGELFRRFGINGQNRCFHGFDGLIPLWMESLSRASEKNIDLASESILLYTFSRFTEGCSKKDNCVNKMIEMTEEEFSDSRLSIGMIAERLGYNSKYLSHMFKEEMGVGYTEYLRTYRIKYAVSLFEHGIDSIKNVALLSGFTDPLYFSTVFKNKIGVSPKSYIKNFFDEEKAEE